MVVSVDVVAVISVIVVISELSWPIFVLVVDIDVFVVFINNAVVIDVILGVFVVYFLVFDVIDLFIASVTVAFANFRS